MNVEITGGALADLRGFPVRVSAQILKKREKLESGLSGDIKALKNAAYGYRLRSGDYRVRFDVEGDTVIVQRVKHRKEAYD